MDSAELQNQVEEVKNNLDAQRVRTSSCLTDHTRHPGDAILNRKYTYSKALRALLWPGLTLAGGALLVVLVKLTQHLAHLSAEARRAARLARRHAGGKPCGLLRGSSTLPPS